jgi:ribosome-associated toxin RatA of RatAB toxin-antitoxin module
MSLCSRARMSLCSRARMSLCVRICMMFVCFACAARAAEEVSVETQRRGDAVEVSARAVMDAPHALVWSTLTDYSKLPEFVPGLRVSRIVERRGATALVHQQGEARFLFFSHPIDVLVESTEYPPSLIEVRLVRGSLRQLSGRYEIAGLGKAAGGRIELRWTGTIEPEFGLTPLIGELLVRANIEDQFLGMVREIDRREAERRRASAEPASKRLEQ